VCALESLGQPGWAVAGYPQSSNGDGEAPRVEFHPQRKVWPEPRIGDRVDVCVLLAGYAVAR
jgi:hypothetical protein